MLRKTCPKQLPWPGSRDNNIKKKKKKVKEHCFKRLEGESAVRRGYIDFNRIGNILFNLSGGCTGVLKQLLLNAV